MRLRQEITGMTNNIEEKQRQLRIEKEKLALFEKKLQDLLSNQVAVDKLTTAIDNARLEIAARSPGIDAATAAVEKYSTY